MVFSAFSSHFSAGVSSLVGRSLNAIVNLVFSSDGGRLVAADIAVKAFEVRVVAIHAPNCIGKKRSLFRRLAPFLDYLKRLIVLGDWNAILDHKIDKGGWRASRLGWCDISLSSLLAEFDLIDRFRQYHPGREIWTWRGDSPSGQIRTHLERVLEELTMILFLVLRSTG